MWTVQAAHYRNLLSEQKGGTPNTKYNAQCTGIWQWLKNLKKTAKSKEKVCNMLIYFLLEPLTPAKSKYSLTTGINYFLIT